jgi:hypothetical protein
MIHDYVYFPVYRCPKCHEQQACNICSNNPQLPASMIKEAVEIAGIDCKTLDR